MKIVFWILLATLGAAGALLRFPALPESIALATGLEKARRDDVSTRSGAGVRATPFRRRAQQAADTHGTLPKLDYAPTAGFETPGLSGAAEIGDATGDGRPDMVVVSAGDGNAGVLTVFAQGADGSIVSATHHPLGAPYNALQGGLALSDLDGVGGLDAVIGTTDGIAVVLSGAGGAVSRSNVVLGREINQVEILDIDRDGHRDVVGLGWGNIMGGPAPEASTLFFNDGRGGLQRTQPMETPQRGYNDMQVGDVTGDGLPDLVIASRQAFHFWVIPHNGSHGFGAAQAYPNQHPIRPFGSVAIGDFNADGRNDVAAAVWANIQDSAVWVYFQNTAGSLSAPVRLGTLDLPGPMLAHDLDNDARQDLVVLHEGGYEYIGRYRQVTPNAQPAEQLFAHTDSGNGFNRQAFAIGDINGDRCPDLVFADGLYGLLFKTGKDCFTSRPQRMAGPAPRGRG